MEFVFWIIIILLFILSFVGLLYPIIPAVLLLWSGVVLYYFFINAEAISFWTWGSFIMFTVMIFVADYMASMYFVKKYGASKRGTTAATIGLIIGSFIIPPFGVFLVPFVLVLLTEIVQNEPFGRSFKIAIGTLFGFLTSTFAKGMIQLIMIIIFLIDILLLG